MKNITIYVSLLACMIISSAAEAQQKEYKGEMNITPIKFEQVGDSLRIQIEFDLAEVSVDSRRSISLIPVVIAPTNELKLPEVAVKGRANFLTSQREVALMNSSELAQYEQQCPYAIIKGYKHDAQKQVDYNKTILFEPWMKNARLDIREDLCGCGNAPRTILTSELVSSVKTERVFNPFLAYVNPVVEQVKQREVSGEVFVDFVVNKIDIKPEYMNNPRELKKITDMISAMEADKNISIKTLSVIGFASPEGDVRANKELSVGRAEALVEYLIPRFNYDRSLYKIEYGAENWDGLKRAVESSDMKYKAEIIDIINTVPVLDIKNNTGRNKSLMDLKDGEPYKYLHKQIYPTLRTAICKIGYEVKGFDAEQAKQVLKSSPENLSLHEIYLVANTYPQGSTEFAGTLATAAKLFPDDATANLNAASAAIQTKDIVAAEAYLSKIKGKIDSPEYHNTIGALMTLKGEHQSARKAFLKASQQGLNIATKNLNKLDNDK